MNSFRKKGIQCVHMQVLALNKLGEKKMYKLKISKKNLRVISQTYVKILNIILCTWLNDPYFMYLFSK